MSIDVNKFKNNFTSLTDKGEIEHQMENFENSQQEMQLRTAQVYNKKFVSLAKGGLIKVITRGDKFVDTIFIDEELGKNTQDIAIEVVKCINKNILDIENELQEVANEVIKKYNLPV